VHPNLSHRVGVEHGVSGEAGVSEKEEFAHLELGTTLV
jgi:hypothetical protein